MGEWTTIRISNKLHETLIEKGKKKETFDKTITRLIDCDKRNGSSDNGDI